MVGTSTEAAGERRGRLSPPPRSLFYLEAPRAACEASSVLPALPKLLNAPRGDGHPVLVLPGFIAGDASTQPLRDYLSMIGYQPHGWRLGRNVGQPEQTLAALIVRLDALHKRYGATVSLVGWSLGGIYARELAKYSPSAVRQVITLGSPFGGTPGSSNVSRLRRLFYGREASAEEVAWRRHLWSPPPVPSTAIYSRSDGVVAWPACMELPGPHTDNIEVSGSHCGLGFNPLVLYAIADRLAQPELHWIPFARIGWRRFLYPDPHRAGGRDDGAAERA